MSATADYTHFDEHGTPQLFDINVPCIFPCILISMSQLLSQLSYPFSFKFHIKSHIETRLVDFEGSMDANGLADLGIMPLGADQELLTGPNSCKLKLRTTE